MRSGPRAVLKTFLAWWGRELAAALPAGLRRALLPERARLEARVEGGGLSLALVEGEVATPVADLPDVAAAPPDRRQRRRIRRAARRAAEVVVRLPPGQVLHPTLHLPVEAAERLEEVLAQEMDRHTPFPAGEVFYDWRVRGSDMELERLFVDLLVARKADVRRAAGLAERAGLVPGRVAGPAASGGGGFNLLPGPVPAPRRRLSARLLRPALAAAVVLLGVWTALWFDRHRAELNAIEADVAALRGEAAEVAALRARIDELTAARAFLDHGKSATPPALAVLAAVTEALPDGDWLHSYSDDGGALRIDGFSRDASLLLGRLEASELLSGAAFGAPVRRDAALGVDAFSIVASVTPGGVAE